MFFFMRMLTPRWTGSVLVVLAMSWVFATNHCAIASLAGGHGKESRSCCEKSAATVPCAESCCAALAAPVPAAGNVDSPTLTLVAFLSEAPYPAPRAFAREASASGASPPGEERGSFFIQFVAGSCHQTMAPPAFVA